jgi:TonB family protein
VAACVLAILATRLGEKDAALQVSIAPVSTVTTLQAPLKPDIASPVSQPPAAKPKRGLEPVYTTPNPPVALTSHAVTADDYPPASIRLQEQGSVKIQYTIGTDGAVSECAVTISSGVPRLDEAACILVKKWTFKPATVIGGAPVAVTIPAEIVFALKGVEVIPASSRAPRGLPDRPAISRHAPGPVRASKTT